MDDGGEDEDGDYAQLGAFQDALSDGDEQAERAQGRDGDLEARGARVQGQAVDPLRAVEFGRGFFDLEMHAGATTL